MPPGRSTAASAASASAGSSTCSSTPWQSTRSALAGLDDVEQAGGVALDARGPSTPALGGAALQRGQRVGAGVDHGDPVAEPGERDREAAGAAADVEDVEDRGVGRRGELSPAATLPRPPRCAARRVRSRRRGLVGADLTGGLRALTWGGIRRHRPAPPELPGLECHSLRGGLRPPSLRARSGRRCRRRAA